MWLFFGLVMSQPSSRKTVSLDKYHPQTPHPRSGKLYKSGLISRARGTAGISSLNTNFIKIQLAIDFTSLTANYIKQNFFFLILLPNFFVPKILQPYKEKIRRRPVPKV